MKNWKLICLTLAALGLSLWAFGQAFTLRDMAFVGAAQPVVAAACTTQINQFTGGSTTKNWNLYSARYLATPWTNSTSGTLCKIVFRGLRNSGATAVTFTCDVRTDTNAPSVRVGTTTATINLSDFPTSEGDVTITFSGSDISLTAGTTYWLVMYSSALSDVVYPGAGIIAPTTKSISKSEDAVTWVDFDNGSILRMTTYQ